MKVIPPLTVSDARLTSSSAYETAPALYAAGTTYALNAVASVAGPAGTGLLTVYKSLQAANTGHTPASSPTWWQSLGDTYQVYSSSQTYAAGERAIDAVNHLVYESLVGSNLGNALSNDAKWVKVGPTNRWAMFDLLRDTATVQPLQVSAVITPGVRVDAIALLGVVANSVRITMTAAGSTVYDVTEDMNLREVSSWREYYFRAFSTKPSIAKFDLPPYANGVITVTANATSGNAEIGACVIGSAEYIGEVQYEAVTDVLNFSTVDRDFAGNVSTMVQRRNVPKTIQEILIDKTRLNRVRAVRDALNGTPAVWAGLEDEGNAYFEAFLILGFYKRFSINAKPAKAVASVELEEI